MSVLINLLPDLRQAKLRAKQRRRLATIGAITVCSISGGLVIVLALYEGAQKLDIRSLTNQITVNKSTLQNTPGLIDALTAQQHLDSLPQLYSQRVYITKFFNAYNQSSPTDITINSLTVDETNVLKVQGAGTSYASVAKLADALAADNVTVGMGANASNVPYFTDISIDQVSKSTDNQVTFGLSANVAEGVTSGQ